MSKRLQVVVDEAELSAIRKTARRQRMTTAEWVRQVLREARRQQPVGEPARRLAVVRAAARHAFPSADIDQMLSEIDQGYAGGDSR